MAQQTNTYSFSGRIKFDPALKTTAAGKSFLPVTVESDNSCISVALFEELATALAAQARQGTPVVVQGYLGQRKDPQSGYWYNSSVCTSYSLDNGNTWVDQKSLKQQQYQTQQGQQQNQQVQHLQQCQSQFQQQPTQSHQPQQQQPTQAQPPIQTIQPQTPAPQQAQAQVQQAQAQSQAQVPPAQTAPAQTREQFLNTNQYTGNQPPSTEAVAAQKDLYSGPQAAPASAPAQKKLTATDPFDDEILF